MKAWAQCWHREAALSSWSIHDSEPTDTTYNAKQLPTSPWLEIYRVQSLGCAGQYHVNKYHVVVYHVVCGLDILCLSCHCVVLTMPRRDGLYFATSMWTHCYIITSIIFNVTEEAKSLTTWWCMDKLSRRTLLWFRLFLVIILGNKFLPLYVHGRIRLSILITWSIITPGQKYRH